MQIIAGVDEAGRGPLVGSVFAAAVILPESYNLPHLTDSKKLSEAKRDELAVLIKKQAIGFAIASANTAEIAQLNILHATMLAMKRAILALDVKPNYVLIDGNRIPSDLPMEAQAIVKGDLTEACISAASILAKTARDAEMYLLHEQYPEYGFAQHKGYGTAKHMDALNEFGLLKEHRQDFAPIKKLCLQGARIR